MADLLEAKEITLKNQKGEDKTFIISKFPCIQGREIVAKYPISAIPKLGDYAVNEETMLKLMNFVAVDNGDTKPLRLSSRALIENHVPDWELLVKLEAAMLEYNCSFFGKGQSLFSSQNITATAQKLITKILMDLRQQSSAPEKQPSTN